MSELKLPTYSGRGMRRSAVEDSDMGPVTERTNVGAKATDLQGLLAQCLCALWSCSAVGLLGGVGVASTCKVPRMPAS